MNENLTELVVVLDRSGSMEPVANDAIGGFNTFLKSQQEAPGEAKITVVQFNTQLYFYAANADVKSVKPLDTKTYVPGGGTALYDAVGLAIDETGKRLAAMEEKDRPSKVIFAILTDGEENSSCKYKGGEIKRMIERQRDVYKWDFVFLAAGEGAFKEAENIGMTRGKTMTFANSGENQSASYDSLAFYASNSRSMTSADYEKFSASINLQSVMNDVLDHKVTASTKVAVLTESTEQDTQDQSKP